MSFLLKIVQGPNAGAEIALAEGTTVAFGRGDACDIVLTDAALGEKAFDLEVTAERVMMLFPDGNQARLEPFHVRTVGTTALVIGPADGAWKPLVKEEAGGDKGGATSSRAKDDGESAVASRIKDGKDGGEGAAGSHTSRKCRSKVGCFLTLFLFVLLTGAVIFWYLFPDTVSAVTDGRSDRVIETCRPYWITCRDTVAEWFTREEAQKAEAQAKTSAETLADVVRVYGLHTRETPAGGMKVTGDFASRVDRLQATARVYRANPGAELDFADRESLAVAIENVLSLVTDGRLKLASVSNRTAKLTGIALSERELRTTLEALSRDVPKLVKADCSGVTAGGVAIADDESAEVAAKSVGTKADDQPTLPVVGILTTPYPCLVLQNGTRVMEGARFGEWTVTRITADSVELGGNAGSFTWRP